MDFTTLLDPGSAAIVVGGTLLATVLRSGWHDCAATGRGLARLAGRRFDAERLKPELARQARDIQVDGLLRAHPHIFGDRELNDATGALFETRSVDALIARHRAHSTRRTQAATTASHTLAQAAELAPVFGLAGTLVSLSQLPAAGLAVTAFAGTISMAVLTTLYGLLLANLVLAPLARAIDRSNAREEEEREKLIGWIADQISAAAPRLRPQTDPQAERHAA